MGATLTTTKLASGLAEHAIALGAQGLLRRDGGEGMIVAMMDGGFDFETVPDLLVEKRDGLGLFQLAANGAISFLSADGTLGWRNLAPAAAIEGSLPRGQLMQWRAGAAPGDLVLTWRYPRRSIEETMTVELGHPGAMTVERVLQNNGQEPLRVHEVRMLAVDGGGVVFGGTGPADLRCVSVADRRIPARADDPCAGPEPEPLPAQARIFPHAGETALPCLAICDAALRTCLLEASLRPGVFQQLWQVRAPHPWRPPMPVLADYAAIARRIDRRPLILEPGGRQRLFSLFYQIRPPPDIAGLCEQVPVARDSLDGGPAR